MIVDPVALAAAESGGRAAASFLELGVIMLVLAALARVAFRMGLSPIPLYLLVGLAFGSGGVLPLRLSEDFIRVGADIGVILLLFMLGLEYTAEELQSSLRMGSRAGVVDLAANFLPGLAAGFALGWDPLGAFVLGGVTYISSSGVIAKVLADLDRLGNRETPAVLTVLVLEDLAMAIYLPLLAALLVGGTFLSMLTSITVAVTAVVVVLVLALRYGHHVSRVVSSRSDEVVLLTILGLILVVAGVAERLQVSSAVGAFLVGIALSGTLVERAQALLGPLRDLFAATFFLFFGLQVDPGGIPEVALLAVLLGVVTAGTKVASGAWAARSMGVGVRGQFRAGAALVARGEFSIVIAGLGVSAGLETQLGPLAAAYVLLMAIAGPVAARLADPIVAAVQARRVMAGEASG